MRAAAVSLAVGLVLADSSIAVLALPAIHRELEVGLGDLHWVLTTFNLALALCAIPAARLVRRAAPALVFRAGLGLFAVASAACALAPTFEALLVARGAQAIGGAAVVVAALELLASVRLWVGAGAVGAALGPALGGVLTETISWHAVFAVQVPIALMPLLVPLRQQRVPRPAASEQRPRLAPNVGLLLLSGGLAAALFLVVLLLIEGWGLSPIGAAAVVSALPVAAILASPLAQRVASVRARASAGSVLVTGGLAGLALLPGAGWAWTLLPQLLVGAGLAFGLAALTEAAVAGQAPRALHGGVTIAARHAGVVLGLLLLTPLLVGDLDRQSEAAERAGTARLLDSRLSPLTKIELAAALDDRLDRAEGRVPELEFAFRSLEPTPRERPVLARLERTLDDLLDRAVTSAFSRPFLLAALLALAALAPAAILRRMPA